jgi:hypothetical protein
MNTAPRASIVTAIHEFRACEELWLEAMMTQTLPSEEFEVIMVDAGGHPTYRHLMKKFCANTEWRRFLLARIPDSLRGTSDDWRPIRARPQNHEPEKL